jgi:hypothetical protein
LNAKIERVIKDIEKAKEKIFEFQTKLKELERQKTELENAEIVDTVRGMDITLADLAAFLKTARASASTSGQVGPKSIPEDKEDSENEE